MICIQHQRKVLPVFAIAATLLVMGVFIAGIVFFKKFRVDTAARSEFIGLVIFAVACGVLIGLCVYCTIVYQRIHRMFLLAATVIATLAIGILAFAVYSYTDVVLKWAGTLWDHENQSAARELEKWFNCTNWSDEEGDQTCHGVIKDFLDRNSNKVSTAIGALFLVFLFCTFMGFYITCNSRLNPETNQSNTGMDDLSFRSDIDAQLNPEGGDKDLIF